MSLTVKLNERQERILRECWADPSITRDELCERLTISKGTLVRLAEKYELPARETGENRWTPLLTEQLKALWSEGKSAGEIARSLKGDFSRNAVIGKVHRLGLAGRATAAAPVVRKPASPSKPRPTYIVTGAGFGTSVIEKPPGHVPLVTIPERDEPPGCCTILTIRNGLCRWPVGDPNEPSFTLCGRTAESTYCREHAQVAYQPATAKKKTTGNELARSLRRYI